MRRSFIAVPVTLAALCASVALAAPSRGRLDDGEFNKPTPNSDITNSAWSLVTNKPDGSDLSARFQFSGFSRSDGANGDGSGLWLRPFEGMQGGANEPLAQATLTQSIVAPVSGDYLLSVDWARETNFSAASWDVTLSSSGTGGSTSVDLLNAAGNLGNFNQILVSFGGPNVANLQLTGVTAGDTLTVEMTMVDGRDSLVNPQSAFIDNFFLRVPEPSSALLAALTAICCSVPRRR